MANSLSSKTTMLSLTVQTFSDIERMDPCPTCSLDMNAIEHLWDQLGKAVQERIRPASFCVSTFRCVKWDLFLENLSWRIFYPKWINQFWISIPVTQDQRSVMLLLRWDRWTTTYSNAYQCLIFAIYFHTPYHCFMNVLSHAWMNSS